MGVIARRYPPPPTPGGANPIPDQVIPSAFDLFYHHGNHTTHCKQLSILGHGIGPGDSRNVQPSQSTELVLHEFSDKREAI